MRGSGHRVHARERPDPRVTGPLRSPDIRASAQLARCHRRGSVPPGSEQAQTPWGVGQLGSRGVGPGARVTQWPGLREIAIDSARMSLMIW